MLSAFNMWRWGWANRGRRLLLSGNTICWRKFVKYNNQFKWLKGNGHRFVINPFSARWVDINMSEAETTSGWNCKVIRDGEAGRRGARWLGLSDFLALKGLRSSWTWGSSHNKTHLPIMATTIIMMTIGTMTAIITTWLLLSSSLLSSCRCCSLTAVGGIFVVGVVCIGAVCVVDVCVGAIVVGFSTKKRYMVVINWNNVRYQTTRFQDTHL